MEDLKLPKQITLSLYDIQDNMFNVYDDYELKEQLGEYLSGEYGYCYNGFNYKVIWNEQFPDQPRKIKITNIDWDTTD